MILFAFIKHFPHLTEGWFKILTHTMQQEDTDYVSKRREIKIRTINGTRKKENIEKMHIVESFMFGIEGCTLALRFLAPHWRRKPDQIQKSAFHIFLPSYFTSKFFLQIIMSLRLKPANYSRKTQLLERNSF